MRKLLPLLIIFLLLSGCKHPESNDYEEKIKETESITEKGNNLPDDFYKVIGVKDGDTFVILFEGKELVVRFAHIDCPEKKQPFGKKAKYFVSDLCFGRKIKLIHENQYDRYKRLIAEVILEDGTNLNKELVKQGLAWHFKKYSEDLEYAELETVAKNNKIGLWSEENPISPWEWRS